MKEKVKITVIHSKYMDVPADAHMVSEGFTKSAAEEYINSNIEKIIGFIQRAGESGTDIVCTHEDYMNAGIYAMDYYNHPGLFAELINKFTVIAKGKMSEAAKKYSMHIVTNNYEPENGNIYNTCTLYGRNGNILGQYKKVHLPEGEAPAVKEGDMFPVFKTDIGNIGFFTCYDVIFPEACRIMALNGADIVIHPTQGWGCGGKAFPNREIGEAFMRVRAAENSIHLVVAKVIWNGDDGGRSCVIDGSGRILGQSNLVEEGLLEVEIEPDYDNYDKYFYDNVHAGTNSTRARQMLKRRPDAYKTLTDPTPPINLRYKGVKLIETPEEWKKMQDGLNKLDDSEKAKYHW